MVQFKSSARPFELRFTAQLIRCRGAGIELARCMRGLQSVTELSLFYCSHKHSDTNSIMQAVRWLLRYSTNENFNSIMCFTSEIECEPNPFGNRDFRPRTEGSL